MKKFLTVLGLWMLAGTGCTKDQNEFIQSPGTDTVWVTQVGAGDVIVQLADTLSVTPSGVSVTLSQSDSVTIAGMQLVLPSGWQTAAGASFSGPATLQASLLQTPGAWIRNFVSTTYGGKLVRTDAVLNISVQEGAPAVLNISAQAGGAALQPTGTVLVSIPSQGSVLQEDSLFGGGYSGNTLQWTGILNYNYFEQTPSEVSFATPQIGWLMYGTLLSDTVNTNAQLVVTLPNEFTNANSAVFCLLNGYASVAALKGDVPSKTFIANDLPVGAAATIVTLTYTGGVIYLGTKNVTLTNGTLAVSISPNIQTLSSLLSFLEQL